MIKIKFIIITIVGIIFILIFILYLSLKNVNQNNPPLSVKSMASVIKQKEDLGLPIHLKIPQINIEADIEYVGITEGGEVDVPEGPTKAAWFDLGPRPGEKGVSIIDGHSGWKNDIPAVFDDLYKLHKGDKIYVTDEFGATTTFVVQEIQKYKKKALVSNIFTSSDGKSHLNLITCTGVWNDTTKSSSDRLIVFADMAM